MYWSEIIKIQSVLQIFNAITSAIDIEHHLLIINPKYV